MRILIVEDNANLRCALAGYLTELGHEVEAVADGRTAVQRARRFAPNALVCDWNLGGGMDGVGVARAVRRTDPAVRLVFITGEPVATLRRETRDLQAASYLPKPVRPAQIAAAVHPA